MEQWIYHVTSMDTWLQAQQAEGYRHDSLEREGFIHAAFAHQLDGVMERFFDGVERVTILCIDQRDVEAEVLLEGPVEEGGPFPHIYGSVNLPAVKRIVMFVREGDEGFKLSVGLPGLANVS